MPDETDDEVWPPKPSWGFAGVTVALIVAAVFAVWAVNYWQAFIAKR